MTVAEQRRTAGEDGVDVESLFEPTAKQRRKLLYRRDGLLTPPSMVIDVEVVAEQAQACAQHYGVAVERLNEREPRVGRVLSGEPGAVAELPVDMAAALLTTRTEMPYFLTAGERRRSLADVAALLDHWTVMRGLAFAAEVLLRAVTEPLWVAPEYWHSRGEYDSMRAVLGVLRNRLAACSDDELPPVIALFERYRGVSRHARVVASCLLPSQRDWVATDISEAVAGGDRTQARLLVDAAGTVDQLRLLNTLFAAHWQDGNGVAIDTAAMAITVVDGVGFEVVEVLTGWFDHWDITQALRIPIAEALAVIPTDTAFAALATRSNHPPASTALRQAAQRFPSRALRLLNPADHSAILREHVHGNADLAREQLADLPTTTATFVADELSRVTTQSSGAGASPGILRNPPWENRKRTKLPTVAGLVPPTEPHCAWLPGEREEWRGLVRAEAYEGHGDALARSTNTELTTYALGALVVAGPERALPLLPTARLLWVDDQCPEVRAAIAVFETAAYPMMVDAAREQPRDMEDVVLPYAGVELVDLAAARLDRRTLRPGALRYLRRHARFVAQVLIPRAVGPTAKDRRLATRVLRLLDGLGYGDDIRSAAQEYGPAAATAMTAVVDADPLVLLPTRMPSVPDWVNVAALPQVRATDGEPLSATGVENLLIMLMLAVPGEPYAGVAQVRRDCDPASLADLSWELFAQWQRAGAPTRHSWVYEALGSFGDDTTVESLLEHVRANRSDARSVTALDAFVAIGSDAALLALKFISEKVRTTRVRVGAKERIEAVADRLGLTADQLADRLVPDLGLRADGTTLLDFGPRRFVVGFDEQLRPTIATTDGDRLKALPKPGVRDDAERAEAAHKVFRRLKKDARAVAADQIKRLERAMVTQRRFTVDELRTLFIAHPLRWHVTRRLVWGVYDGETLTGTVRIAEDRTFADSTDDTVSLPDDTVLGVAHPIQFPNEVTGWGEIFADYELLQPFPQMGREVYTVPDELLHASKIVHAGDKADGPRFLSLAARGWLPPETDDGGHIYTFEKPLPHGRYLVISADPGLAAYNLSASNPQSFGVYLRQTRSTSGSITFADLDEVTASEILRDIAWLNSAAN
ncbi:DUF4132 domain-containing protein [Nocardia uniformis]|uniref:DUF4132 domain-containing protein n=1 Tax=Nocardia uniformis TaxID=53432 RepID=A0A849C3Q0_9NOCA|nr:DUF4132 domain-containing protein [Nocardia uniformis]NNH71070.1 DUF4132 domain-containing protein [Nocardia uniformis]